MRWLPRSAAYKALVVLPGAVSFEISEDLIHPGACDVHRNRGAGPRISLPQDVGEFDALHVAVLEDQAVYFRVGNDGCAVVAG